jgi:predicted PurR-regulated permease PerM
MPSALPVSRQTLLWLAVAAGFVVLMYLLGPVFTPFFLAWILAYITHPLVRRMRRAGIPRVLAVVLVLLLLTAILALLVLIVLPLFVKEVQMITQQFPGWLERLNTTLAPKLNEWLGTEIQLDPGSIKEAIQRALQTREDLGMRLLDSLRMGGLGLLGLFANIVLVPVVLFFLLRDWGMFMARLQELIPKPWRESVLGFVREADSALDQYLHGQMLVIATMCVLYPIGLWLTGLKFWLPIGIITGLLVFVPYVGAATGFVLATLAALMQFDDITRVGWVWAVFVAGQALEGNLITPKLVGERIGLHPVAVIFALLAFGQLFGFAGLLVALPASAVLLVALRKLRAHYFASELYKGG